MYIVFFCKQKTAYEMRISDLSSDVCSSDLTAWDDYAKRLPPDCALDLREIKLESRTTGKTPAQMMAAEARRIEAAIPAGALRLALDERGRDQIGRAHV